VQKFFNALKSLGAGNAAMLIISRLFSTVKSCLHQYLRIIMLSTYVYKISHLNFKPLLRKLPKTPRGGRGGLLLYAALYRTLIGSHRPIMFYQMTSLPMTLSDFKG